ncbi:MAG: YeeE/YedE thiosulfate transporter family protein [Hansschlegelia sp.]
MTRPLFLKHLSSPRPGVAGIVLLVAALAAATFALLDGGFGYRGWPLVAGIVFGVALQRGELSLVRAWRDLLVLKDSNQLLGFLAALFAAQIVTLGALALLGVSAPPTNARIGPVSWILAPAAFMFGVGSVVARGGIMVHLRRLGEGSLVATPALLATFAGFVGGLALWPWTWAHAVHGAPAPFLPDTLGYAGALVVQLAVIAALSAMIWRRRPAAKPDPRTLPVRLMVEPWPATSAGALLGLLVAVSYAAGEPLGLIAECATAARWLATMVGLAPADLPGLSEGVGGIVVPLMTGFAVTEHVVIVIGFVVGAFACALASGRFSLAGFTMREGIEMVVGGLLLGLGAMTALGAVTGEAIAGVAIGAASGWIFLAFASLGIIVALKLDPRQAVTHPGPEPTDVPEGV